MTEQVKTTFQLVFFPKLQKYIGIAHNYDHAFMVATAPHSSYTAARVELEQLTQARGGVLQWFDGEYETQGHGDSMIPRTPDKEWRAVPETKELEYRLENPDWDYIVHVRDVETHESRAYQGGFETPEAAHAWVRGVMLDG